MNPSDWPPSKDPGEIAAIIEDKGLLTGKEQVGKGSVCQFMGMTLAVDFDITPLSLAPFVATILDKLIPLEIRLDAGEFEKIELGIYGGEVRVWAVSSA